MSHWHQVRRIYLLLTLLSTLAASLIWGINTLFLLDARHSLMASAGGVVAQSALGRVADVSGYGASYLGSAVLTAAALPFVIMARREHAPSDPIVSGAPIAPIPAPAQPIEPPPLENQRRDG